MMPLDTVAAIAMVISALITAISNMYVSSKVSTVKTTLDSVHTAVNSTASALAATATAKDKEIEELRRLIAEGKQREALLAQSATKGESS
jgi:hypothetical protein